MTERVTCRVCGREVSVTKAGKLRHHVDRTQRRMDGSRFGVVCGGAGENADPLPGFRADLAETEKAILALEAEYKRTESHGVYQVLKDHVLARRSLQDRIAECEAKQ